MLAREQPVQQRLNRIYRKTSLELSVGMCEAHKATAVLRRLHEFRLWRSEVHQRHDNAMPSYDGCTPPAHP